VIKADGRDTRGQGNANALITAEMTADGPGRTNVTITTDLTVTGKVAQFGRGVMADVSAKLLGQFADNLSTMVLADRTPTRSAAQPEPAREPAASSASTPAVIPSTQTATATGSAPVVTTTASAPAVANGAVLTTTAAPRREVLTAEAARANVRTLDLPEPDPIDLLGTAGTPLLKRIAPFAALAALVAILMRLFGSGKQ
jgi:hypothetical protein